MRVIDLSDKTEGRNLSMFFLIDVIIKLCLIAY